MYDSDEVNDVERGVALRMPLPNLCVVAYRVMRDANLTDGSTVRVQQLRNERMTPNDEALCLYREAEQLQGLCDWLQEQLAMATGASRFAHHYLKTMAASLKSEGVVVNAETFEVQNIRAESIEQRFMAMLSDADQRGLGFIFSSNKALQTYEDLTGRDADPLIMMALQKVLQDFLTTFLKGYLS